MLAVQCPRCASPCPVSLAEIDQLSCGRCGHVGPMPEDAAGRLRAGAELLGTLDRRAAQLTDAQRRSLTWSWAWVAVHLLTLPVIAAPIAITALAWVVITLLCIVCSSPARPPRPPCRVSPRAAMSAARPC